MSDMAVGVKERTTWCCKQRRCRKFGSGMTIVGFDKLGPRRMELLVKVFGDTADFVNSVNRSKGKADDLRVHSKLCGPGVAVVGFEGLNPGELNELLGIFGAMIDFAHSVERKKREESPEYFI
ncbi:MAG: hypothetical protein GY852_04090 [bacterium]|nr:hypothetical protein [bacterium]